MRTLKVELLPMEARFKQALVRFLSEAKDAAGSKISRIVLYGSVARGEAAAESDIDLLVEWRGPVQEALDCLVPITGRILLECGVDISVHPVPEGHLAWLQQLDSGFSRAVHGEGVIVT